MIDQTQSSSNGLPEPLAARPLHPHLAASRGLAALLGLDCRAALLTILVDMSVFGVDTFSLETLLPLSAVVSAALGFVVFRIQRHYHRDDREAALIKSVAVAILTFIPLPIAPLFSVPAGILGMIASVRHTRKHAMKENQE